MFNAPVWRDYFVMVGGGAASLAGLVFVAMSVLFFGHTWGLYAVGVGMMASFLFIVSGAWLLLVGVESQARAG